jgi:hypothetical protein
LRIRERIKNEKIRIIENQKKKIRDVTFMEVFWLVGKLGQVYGGLIFIKWGIDLYDSGQSLPFIAEYPEATSLFIIIMLAIIFMVQ